MKTNWAPTTAIEGVSWILELYSNAKYNSLEIQLFIWFYPWTPVSTNVRLRNNPTKQWNQRTYEFCVPTFISASILKHSLPSQIKIERKYPIEVPSISYFTKLLLHFVWRWKWCRWIAPKQLGIWWTAEAARFQPLWRTPMNIITSIGHLIRLVPPPVE